MPRAPAGDPLPGAAAAHDEPTIALVRPLLGWRRSELREIVVAGGIPFVDDPGNADDRYDRTRFRALLDRNGWLDPLRLAATAAFAREGHEALEAMIDWLWTERQTIPAGAGAGAGDRDRQTWLDLSGLPREIRRRLARAAIRRVRDANRIVRPAFSPAANIEPLLDAADAGTPAMHAGILVSRRGDLWHFRPAPPRRETR